jgi:hypothetical protein
MPGEWPIDKFTDYTIGPEHSTEDRNRSIS